MESNGKGVLVIIGVKEDKSNKCVILREVAKLAGGINSKIIILTVATDYPSDAGREYKHLFRQLGVQDVEALHIETRENANNTERLERMRDTDCVFFTGGDQLKITSLVGGTRTEDFLRVSFEAGLVIAGTSAGASVMSETMITSGEDDKAPRRCTVKMAPGLGLINGVVIDQHFAQRGRIGRLLAAVSQNPKVLGIGIDEDTAIVVKPDRSFEVIGSNAVTVLDGTRCSHTNVSESRPDDILAITDIMLHILPAKYEYDLISRAPILRR